jgi:hypothetical protein
MRTKKYIKNFFRFFPSILKEKDRKSLLKIFIELIVLFLRDRALPVHYFSRYLYIKGSTNYKDFVPNKTLYSMWKKYNDASFLNILDNKLLFHIFFNKLGIPITKILAHNTKIYFYINNSISVLKEAWELNELLKNIFNNHTKNNSLFIKRCCGSSGGYEIFKIYKDELPLEEEYLNSLFNLMLSSSFVIEETINQHQSLNKLNPYSINTLRIDTFRDKNNNTEVISALLRLGVSNSYVDNTSSGGCYVGVELNKGQLKEVAYTSFTVSSGKRFTKHPNTGIILKGFEIPYFNEAKELAVKAASYLPAVRLVGWDISITENGPVIIEGNHDYDITGAELAYGGYRKNKVFQKVLNEI